ncbi:MAG TPA: ferritin-like domain-containing protein [Kofleriaceae bacterium]|nr:ferritin-like domain-containing protein [Kofleriaceae bacterium]
MTQPEDGTRNRTGIHTAKDAKQAIQGAAEGTPDSARTVEPRRLTEVRGELVREAGSLGTVPRPVTLKGTVKATIQTIKGHSPAVLVDLLAARLAFERTGTRLYDALLIKHEAAHIPPGGPGRDDLELIRDQELRHMGLLSRCLETLGADPTAVTPAADVGGVAGAGLVAVVADPRVTFTQALDAMVIAELADNDAWVTLADLADRLGMDEMAADFREALVEEEDHLARVRAWLNAAITAQAGLSPSPQPPPPEAHKPIS